MFRLDLSTRLKLTFAYSYFCERLHWQICVQQQPRGTTRREGTRLFLVFNIQVGETNTTSQKRAL